MAFDRFQAHQAVTVTRTVDDADIRAFAEVSGDHNPVHLDDEAAAQSRFGRRIAHGMLSAAYISAALANELPGPGVIYLSQSLRFIKPVYVGNTISVKLEIVEILPEKRRLRIQTTCLNQDHDVVLEGEALVHVPE